MNTKDDVAYQQGALLEPRPFALRTLHEVNERCIELLVNAARNERREQLPLVRQLREILRSTSPETRRRAAQRGFLLVDIEFRDGQWWQGVQREPAKRWRTLGWHQAFPRRTAVPLARATLMMAWHSIQEDLETASVLLGMSREVAGVIAGLQLSDIDRIADRRFRHVLPRWHDHPDFWRELFEAAASGTPSALRHCNLRGLQLLTGQLLRTGHAGRRDRDVSRPRVV